MFARRSRFVVRALLLVLLLAVQALCHAHAIDHHFDGDSAACVVCSTSGNLEDAVAGDAGPSFAPDPAQAPVPPGSIPEPAGFTARPCARAPPSPS